MQKFVVSVTPVYPLARVSALDTPPDGETSTEQTSESVSDGVNSALVTGAKGLYILRPLPGSAISGSFCELSVMLLPVSAHSRSSIWFDRLGCGSVNSVSKREGDGFLGDRLRLDDLWGIAELFGRPVRISSFSVNTCSLRRLRWFFEGGMLIFRDEVLFE